MFKCDLLCFLHLLHPGLPREGVLALLRCLSQDADENPWVCALISQLHKDIGVEEFRKDTLLTPECVQSLKAVCEQFRDSQKKRGWDLCLSEHKTDELSPDYQTDTGHTKRKTEVIDHHMDGDVGEPQSKRRKTDLVAQGDPEDRRMAVDQEESGVKTVQLDKELEGDSSATLPVPEEHRSGVLPDHTKVKWKWAHIIKTFCENSLVYFISESYTAGQKFGHKRVVECFLLTWNNKEYINTIKGELK